MGRAPCCDKANVKKGPWSAEEDAKLRDFIGKFGTGGNWISLPQKAGLRRCGKSCRLRWLNYLRPNIKHGEFCEEEDRIICSLYASIGSRWSIIASHLPGRTDNDIKNYWNTKLKKKLMLINQRKIPQPFHNSPQPTSQIQGHSTMMPNLSQLLSDFTPFTPPGAGRYTNLPSPGFESSQPLSPNFLFNNTPDNLTSLNQYYGIEMQDGVMSNLGRYLNNNKMVMFGSNNNEAASCSSSDGSYCSQMSFGNIKEIKQESMSYVHHQLQPSTNGYEDEQKLILDYGSSTYTDNVVSGGYFGNPNHALLFEGYYDNLEEVKELISTNNNNNNGSLYLKNDENKTYQRTMYFD